MSPHVANFVHDLVAMAKAMEENPILQEQIEALKAQLGAAQDHNAGLEVNIISYKQQIDNLQAKVRSLEVERDDASFRTMESEDLAHKALSFIRQAEIAAAAAMSLLTPPKPEPIKEPEPVLPQAIDSQSYEDAHPKPFEPLPDATQGQSEGPSSSAPVDTSEQTASPTVQTVSIESPQSSEPAQSPSADTDPEPTPKWTYEWYQWNDRRNERAARQASAF